MEKKCSLCKKIVDSENAPILTMGGFGNPRYLCDECAANIEVMTTAREVDVIKANRPIIILDEPTASLDPIAEQEIFNQFDRPRNNKMTVFVSHRLSSATIADKILVIEDGCLIEQGSHVELMAQQGKYHELFTTQSKRYVTGGEGGERPPEGPRPFPRHRRDVPEGFRFDPTLPR